MNLPVPLALRMTPSRHWRCMNLHFCLTHTQLILHPFVTKLCSWCDSALPGLHESPSTTGPWRDSLDAASILHESPPLSGVC
jgi:hypothetical protein